MSVIGKPDPSVVRERLLTWYDANARALPWRVGPAARAAGERPDPYAVWLSEIMLQQTTVPHAAPYFLEFLKQWPTVEALAAADEGEVMNAWAGLGYYARARNLTACARVVAVEHGGRFPGAEAGLRTLPGLGAYTAAAVAAIAFDQPANVVDGNVERVVARLFAFEPPLPGGKAELVALADTLVDRSPDARPGDWAQALMDLGAGICRPKAPLCDRCPIADLCQARATGEPAAFPRKSDKAVRPKRFGVVYVQVSGDRVALVRRPPKGLLGGMLGLPTTEWRPQPWTLEEAEALSPADRGAWRALGAVRHVFTHFELELTVLVGEGEAEGGAAIWTPMTSAAQALPTVFRKALARAEAAFI